MDGNASGWKILPARLVFFFWDDVIPVMGRFLPKFSTNNDGIFFIL